MRKWIICLAGLLAIGAVLFISTSTNSSKASKKNDDDSKSSLSIESHAELTKIYSDLPSLVKDADIVIEGTVISTSTKYYKESLTPSTLSQVKVAKVISGNVKVGDVLTFEETGGFTTKKYVKERSDRGLPLQKSEENDQIEFTINGINVMKKGEQVALFGRKNKESYSVLGEYQGKFRVRNDHFERQVPKGEEKAYSSLQVSSANFEQEVKKYTK